MLGAVGALSGWTLARGQSGPLSPRIRLGRDSVRLLPTKAARAYLDVVVEGVPEDELDSYELRAGVKSGRLIDEVPVWTTSEKIKAVWPNKWRDMGWPQRMWPDGDFKDSCALGAEVIVQRDQIPKEGIADGGPWDVSSRSGLRKDGDRVVASLAVRGFSLGGQEDQPAEDVVELELWEDSVGAAVAKATFRVESCVEGLVAMPVDDSSGLTVKRAQGGGRQPNVFVRPEVLTSMRLTARLWRELTHELVEVDPDDPSKTYPCHTRLVVTDASLRWGGLYPPHQTHRSGMTVDVRYPSIILPGEELDVDHLERNVICVPIQDESERIAWRRYSFLSTRALCHAAFLLGARRMYTSSQVLVDTLAKDGFNESNGARFAELKKNHANHLHIAWGAELWT